MVSCAVLWVQIYALRTIRLDLWCLGGPLASSRGSADSGSGDSGKGHRIVDEESFYSSHPDT